MIGILVVILLVIVLIRMITTPANVQTVQSNNHQLLNDMHFSAQEFYSSVENVLNEQMIGGLNFSRITYAEGGMLSARREYLRIRRREYVFDVCAAPFGRGTFVSWWLGEVGTPLRDRFSRIPFIGQFFVKRMKTYFELDNEAMFRESVISVINSTIKKFSEIKGVRSLEIEWQTKNGIV